MTEYKHAYVPRGKIRRTATVTCQADGCLHEMSADSTDAIDAFHEAGWTSRRGPKKTDGINWRCPTHAHKQRSYPDENGYY